MPAQLSFKNSFPDLQALPVLFHLDPMLDPGLGLGGLDELEPVLIGNLGLRGQNLDGIAVTKRMAERNDLFVDLGPDTVITDLGMDAVSKVYRSGSFDQLLTLPFRRKTKPPILNQIQPDRVHKLTAVHHVRLPLHQLPEPSKEFVVFGINLS